MFNRNITKKWNVYFNFELFKKLLKGVKGNKGSKRYHCLKTIIAVIMK